MAVEVGALASREMNTSDEAVVTAIKTAQKLDTQVAGHMYNESRKQMGMLDLGNGLVLKPIQDPPRGTREMEFYQQVFDPACTNPDIISLRQFLPPFHGVLETEAGRFLKLSNITWNYKNPSVLDIKVGKKTYDPLASAEKIERENAKFPPALKLGYQFVGMLLYNPDTKSSEKTGKDKLRSITEERILEDGLGRFFGLGWAQLRQGEITAILARLEQIEQWMLTQRTFNFYASSLLMVYDSDSSLPDNRRTHCGQGLAVTETPSRAVGTGGCGACGGSAATRASIELPECERPGVNSTYAHASVSPNQSSTVRAEVFMIDFAHVFPSTSMDENYLAGLRSIILHLRQLLQD